MPEYRRVIIEGGIYFFTVVTYKRKKIFLNPEARKLLGDAFRDVKGRFPFNLDAVCLPPDHLHCIWSLPEADNAYSIRWKEIKRLFSKHYNLSFGEQEVKNKSHQKRNEVEIWQRRFWEHTIRDEKDYENHLDYIHYNPVKHGLVKSPKDWPWASFRRYVRLGVYDKDLASIFTIIGPEKSL